MTAGADERWVDGVITAPVREFGFPFEWWKMDMRLPHVNDAWMYLRPVDCPGAIITIAWCVAGGRSQGIVAAGTIAQIRRQSGFTAQTAAVLSELRGQGIYSRVLCELALLYGEIQSYSANERAQRAWLRAGATYRNKVLVLRSFFDKVKP
jgi:hypothetical protein